MKIIYHFNKCVGCGLCVSTCPNIWQWDTGRKARLKNPDQINDQWESGECPMQSGLIIVASNCPVGAIQLEESDGIG